MIREVRNRFFAEEKLPASTLRFEELAGGKTIFEDLHILQLNDFSRYLDELRARVVEARDDE